MTQTEHGEILTQRLTLVSERIREIAQDPETNSVYARYFKETALFLCEAQKVFDGTYDLSSMHADELEDLQMRFWQDILPAFYEESYANPVYAAEVFGKKCGRLLCFLKAQLYAAIAAVYEKRLENWVILQELYVEIHGCFAAGGEPDLQEVNQTIYWYFHDYSEVFANDQVRAMLCPEDTPYTELIMHADLTDLRYLYHYGLFIGENEKRTAAFLNTLSEDQIQSMADAFTEGYRMGFEAAGKDIAKKKTVTVYYAAGFERMMRAAIKNFRKMGLSATIMRQPFDSYRGYGLPAGVYTTPVNRQFCFDHKEDAAVYLDKRYVERRLAMMEHAFEMHRDEALVHGGPAVQEVFGALPFSPQEKKDAIRFDERQQSLSLEQRVRGGAITWKYIPAEERSYTIIAWPVPEIGNAFEEIFTQTVAINTLDYQLYQRMQQALIDVLDGAHSVRVLGRGANQTDLVIGIQELSDPDTQTAFENCVADVNIPLGEIFTTPVIERTNGLLHVSQVYIDGLSFRDLKIRIKDGMAVSYTCANFEEEETAAAYIRDQIFARHPSLPVSEFAIGTNTTAYEMGQTFDIMDRLPILIAEKTGPHIAFGDTCYSREEEVRVFNPDGKEIIAKDNTRSLLRREDPQKAYYNCHMDITIPFDEIGSITAVCPDGSSTDIIKDGRFAVAGTEKLNEPLIRLAKRKGEQ